VAIFDMNIVPNAITVRSQDNTALFTSPLIGSAQTLDRGGHKWRMQLTFTNLQTDERAELMGIIMALRGRANRLRVNVHDNPKRGAYGGTPLVFGGGQTGSTLNIDGCSTGITNWIRRGDYFSVIVNGDHELKMCTEDANSDGGGAITGLKFEPRLKDTPLDNAIITVDDGVIGFPRGIFLLESSGQGWTSKPGKASQLSDVSLALVEDVFATQ
jgi:hypothetical protein